MFSLNLFSRFHNLTIFVKSLSSFFIILVVFYYKIGNRYIDYITSFTVTSIDCILIFSLLKPKARVSFPQHLSSVNFLHFDLLKSRWVKLDRAWISYSLSYIQDGCFDSDWLKIGNPWKSWVALFQNYVLWLCQLSKGATTADYAAFEFRALS